MLITLHLAHKDVVWSSEETVIVYLHVYEGVSKRFRTESITKYTIGLIVLLDFIHRLVSQEQTKLRN
jgi:hypothetical protein